MQPSSDHTRRSISCGTAFVAYSIIVWVSAVLLANSGPMGRGLIAEITPPPPISHSVDLASGLHESWHRPSVRAGLPGSPQVVAGDGKVCIMGSLGDTAEVTVSCLDGRNGTLDWKITPDRFGFVGYLSTLYATPDGLYVGYGGVPSVRKYAWSDGRLLWSQPLAGRGLLWLYAVDDQVQVTTDPFTFTVLDTKSGRILRTSKGEEIYITMPDRTFLKWGGYALRATDTDTGNLQWNAGFDRQLWLAPAFGDNAIYLRTDETLGTAYALERRTGQILWNTGNAVVSQIAVSPNKGVVYALSQGGELWSIDAATGTITTAARFTSVPFHLSGDRAVGGYAVDYEVAYDASAGSIFVLLGDSAQLFAFSDQ